MILLLLFPFLSQASFDTDMRDHLKWDNVGIARAVSDVGQITMMVAPFVVAGMNKCNRKENLLASGLAMGFNKLITGGIKYVTGRERPDGSNKLSFPSGHTSSAFTSAALVCGMADRYTCVTGLLIASSVGYLRIAGDRHWASDVAVGMALGVANGVLIPKLVMTW